MQDVVEPALSGTATDNARTNWLVAPTGRHCLWIALVLAAITLAVYWPARGYEFLELDDNLYITGNPVVQQGLTWPGIVWAFAGFHASNWHPVTWLSHMLDCSLFGATPGGHHFVNVLFHAANAVLLFLLLRRMTGAVWRAALVAALFAWHPLHVESVAWVAERKDVLSTLFLILTVWAYTRYAEKPGSGRYAMVALWFALGLMSKPMLVTVPCLLLLLDYWPLGRLRVFQSAGVSGKTESIPLGKLLLEKLPLFALAAAASWLTILAQRAGDAVAPLDAVPLATRAANALTAYAAYLGKTVWPADLAVYYPLEKNVPVVALGASVLLLALISAVVWRARRERGYLAVGWLWYLVTLLPVIGLVQVGGQAMADRYTYVPLIGVFVMMAWGVAPWFARDDGKLPMKLAVTGALLLGCLSATARQSSHWRNGVRLFTHSVRVTRDNHFMHHNLGVALATRGHRDEAIAHYAESLRLYPGSAKAHYNLGLELLDAGESARALTHFTEAVKLTPLDAAAQNNLATVLAEQKRFDEAGEHFRRALQLAPRDAKSHCNFAKALLQQGRPAEAAEHFRAALEIVPDWPEALNSFAVMLATHGDAGIRDGARAVRLAEKANQLTGHAHPTLLSTLAAAYAEVGQFERAVTTARQAHQLASTAGRKNMSEQIERCVLLYQAGKPYRQAVESPQP